MKLIGKCISHICGGDKAEIEIDREGLVKQLDFNELCHLHLILTTKIESMQDKPTEQKEKETCANCKFPCPGSRGEDWCKMWEAKPIPKEKIESIPLSKCCNAFVVTIQDEILYMCQACNHPCDLAEEKECGGESEEEKLIRTYNEAVAKGQANIYQQPTEPPKSKDRIEELTHRFYPGDKDNDTLNLIIDKVNEIIQRINERG